MSWREARIVSGIVEDVTGSHGSLELTVRDGEKTQCASIPSSIKTAFDALPYREFFVGELVWYAAGTLVQHGMGMTGYTSTTEYERLELRTGPHAGMAYTRPDHGERFWEWEGFAELSRA